MIIAPNWIWLHFPKCAGSAAEKLLRSVYGSDRSVVFDDVGPGKPVIWHQTIAQRRQQDPSFDPGGRRVVANIRRLPNWLLSRVHFEVQRSGAEGAVPRQALLRGDFLQRRKPSDEKPTKLVNADRPLAAFAAEVTDWVRSEQMVADLSRILGFEASTIGNREQKVNVGRIEYVRDLAFWFTPGELEGLYENNPVWADLERKVYGDVIKL